MGIIERVAAALAGEHPNLLYLADAQLVARTAIAALREPDGAMCEAGGEELAAREFIESWHLAEMVWRAMIDAALREQISA
jgi:hypothetical protein